MTKKNTTSAFYAFLDWSEGKSFNEILGCAKSQIDNLTLIWDVDDYNFNEIACRVRYWDVFTDTSCRVEIKVLPNGQLNMINLDEPMMDNNSRLHEKSCEELQNNIVETNKTDTNMRNMTIPCRALDNNEETNREFICKFLGTSDESAIAEVWNECVDNTNPNKYDKLYPLDKYHLSMVLECLTEEEKDKVILNLYKDGFDNREFFFYVTQNCEIRTTNSVWAHMDYDVLFAFFRKYYTPRTIEKYGYTWEKQSRVNDTDYWKHIDAESLICTMENGEKIYTNTDYGIVALVLADGVRYERLFV